MLKILRLIRRPKVKKEIKNCSTCRFNEDVSCYAGTYYAAKGQNRICFDGELWESNELNK